MDHFQLMKQYAFDNGFKLPTTYQSNLFWILFPFTMPKSSQHRYYHEAITKYMQAYEHGDVKVDLI